MRRAACMQLNSMGARASCAAALAMSASRPPFPRPPGGRSAFYMLGARGPLRARAPRIPPAAHAFPAPPPSQATQVVTKAVVGMQGLE